MPCQCCVSSFGIHRESQEANLAATCTISDELVVLLDLWQTSDSFEVEKNPSPSCLSIENDMTLEVFLVKATRQNLDNAMKNPMIPYF